MTSLLGKIEGKIKSRNKGVMSYPKVWKNLGASDIP